ncbi:DEAD/DEAH box helicase [Microbacterium sp.]|uniref:DEAD/DEAH box helicase n=1 Tax=Microbacterium sp. TaxID=51671 RepID=UPI002735D794|nr:DEAD/DEAH box helicase family protein [Microbacterium sp.]MDP3950093.1 DEAD/DEAH box helicase family protein [Microbacterium sp.]
MRFTLEDYQQTAVDRALTAIGRARRDFDEDSTERTAVGLTAPTGAGKTVIATAVLESIYFGTEVQSARPNTTVLWVTDDRSLNAQTIGKILQASGGRIDANRVRFVGDTDERTLEPGYIYFVHIQALQRNSTLHAIRADGARSDRRTFGAWEMIANTVRERGKDFLVVWDEAHRGSGVSSNERRSIAGTIVNGGTTNIGTQQPAAPIVLGISATPERFQAAMSAAGRTMRPVEVPPADVRDSGLLKDRILIRNIAEEQRADNTMLALAVEDLRASSIAWRAYHEASGDRLVEPLLVVQVEPKVTDGRLVEILTTLESKWPELSDYAVAHCFGDPHGPISVGGKTVRYLPPEAISDDDRARVVLFKSALTTGWDCPRAEVMVSFQGKDSYTEIAQLIGRLVRTPLAKRVDGGDDRLDEVVAYLPGYKTEHVQRVVNALTDDETVRVEILIAPEVCSRSGDVPTALFDVLDSIPSYERPRVAFSSRTAQLMRLAAALNEHDILAGASAKAKQWIVDQMRAADRQRNTEVEARFNDTLTLTVETSVVGYGEVAMISSELSDVATVEGDLDSYFVRAQRLLPDGSAAWYFNDLCDHGEDEIDAGVRLAAMASLGFKDVIEQAAADQIETWRQAHAAAVARKPRTVRDLVEPLWFLGTTAMHPTTIVARSTYPAATEKVINGRTVAVDVFPRHLYVVRSGRSNAGLFPVDTYRSSWERDVLERELGEQTLLGWYRNPSSGRHALAVPYEYGGKTRLMHPDFLFFHQDDDGVNIDVVDPHRHDLSDAAPKWSALAQYAQDHPDRLRRVIAVSKVTGGALRALDLREPGMADQLGASTNPDLLEDLFVDRGYAY